VKSRPTTNPTNRFHSVGVTYEDGDAPPPSSMTLIDDQSRSILASNDSPDVGFRWSVNPYRGCSHACAYCLDGATPILLGDCRTRRLDELAIGDEIYGTVARGHDRYYTRTRVIAHWQTRKPAFRIALADGTELVASGDHRFLTERGWKFVTAAARPSQRPFLTTNNKLVGIGWFTASPTESVDYRRGYLCGMIRGDALLRRYDYSGKRRENDVQHQFRLALADLEALARAKRYLAALDVETSEFAFSAAQGARRAMRAIRCSSRSSFAAITEAITDAIVFPAAPTFEWSKGFLAGIFDAEGSHSEHVLRISNANPELIARIGDELERFGFDAVIEPPKPNGVRDVRVRGGRSEHLRFFHLTNPAITRKWDLDGNAVKCARDLRVVSIEPVGERDLFDITTGTGDFIANGVVSHNCYARPSHEYLDMGAGTDFDTKIVVKRRAPELLREAFDKPSWRGELVMFSGVTDCYQAAEAELGLTRGCLEVCLEYRNPCSIITKSALIERDVELLAELAREAGCHVSVSLTWVDAELARAIEPWAPSPARRLKVIERLAAAGVPVGVMCGPVIPGLNDDQLVRVLEAAHAAGATHAGWVLLRLPGAVKAVFEERVRAALPLAADKILHRIRETRGGDKLYDPRFGVRGRGEGPYAQAIAAMFDATVVRLGLNRRDDGVFDVESRFRRPKAQLDLF
jgi:DNA repair photolyase